MPIANFRRNHVILGQRVLNRWPGDLSFRREERLGRLARSRDPLAIVAARVRSLPSIKQELLRRSAAHNIEKGIR